MSDFNTFRAIFGDSVHSHPFIPAHSHLPWHQYGGYMVQHVGYTVNFRIWIDFRYLVGYIEIEVSTPDIDVDRDGETRVPSLRHLRDKTRKPTESTSKGFNSN